MNGDFKFNESNLPNGWDLYHSESTILIYNRSGDNWLTSQNLFSFTGSVNIGSVLFANSKGIEIDGTVNELPNNFIVYPVYPNPFNPKTNVEFEITQDQFINIQLFNLKGRKVKSLANKVFNQGKHNLLIDGSFLTSGIYLLKIKSDQIDRTLKLYLIK